MTSSGQTETPRWRRIGFANVVAVIALFVALGGGAYAASKIGTSDIKNKAITSAKIDKKAVKSSKIAKEGVKTNKLQDGAATESKIGDAAITNSKLGHPIYLAYVQGGLAPTLSRTVGAVGVTRINAGNYRVDFARDLSQCYYVATPTYLNNSRHISAALDVTNNQRVAVRVRNQNNTSTDSNANFSLAVHC